MIAHRRPVRRSFLALAAVAAAGCSDGRVPVYPVEGTVTFKGEALTEGQVTFAPVEPIEGLPWPSGPLGEGGRYELTTYEVGDGAPAGAYRVMVSTARSTLGDGPLAPKAEDAAAADPLAGRYVDPEASGREATVEEGENSIPTFALD